MTRASSGAGVGLRPNNSLAGVLGSSGLASAGSGTRIERALVLRDRGVGREKSERERDRKGVAARAGAMASSL